MVKFLGSYQSNPYFCRLQRLPVKKNTLLLLIFVLFFAISAQEASAQNRRRVIQLSGIVTDTTGGISSRCEFLRTQSRPWNDFP